MNKEKRILCDGCKVYTDSFFITEYKDGKSYCSACNIKLHIELHNKEQLVKESEFDKMIKAAVSTPQLKLKDLKERLKKERKEKESTKRISENKKDSK